MKYIWAILVLAWHCCLWAAVTIPEQSGKNMLIDGELTEPQWQAAAQTGTFLDLQGKDVTEKTHALLFCDADNLYVGFHCHFRDRRAKEREIANAKSKDVFSLDDVEVFLAPGNTGVFSQFAVNISGAMFKERINGPIQVGVQLRQQHWSAEICIPFRALQLPQANIEPSWKLNVARGNPAIKEWTSWSKLENTFHDIDHFTPVRGITFDIAALAKRQHAGKGTESLEQTRLVYDQQPQATMTWHLNQRSSLKGHAIATKLFDQGNKLLYSSVHKPVFFKNFLSIPISKLPNGKYRTVLVLLDADCNATHERTAYFWKVPPKNTRNKNAFAIKDQCLYKNGTFFFPIAIWDWSFCATYQDYNDHDASWFYTEQEKITRDIKEHGFNTVINNESFFAEDAKAMQQDADCTDWHEISAIVMNRWNITSLKLMEQLQQHGLHLILLSPFVKKKVGHRQIDGLIRQILRFRDHDNLMLWFIADETDGQIQENKLRNSIFKAMDDRPTWLNVILAVNQNKDAADILSRDPYPIPDGLITTVSGAVDQLIAQTQNRSYQSQWLWIQNFGDEGAWTRPPTPEELQVMTTLALNHGVKGLAYFTYVSPQRRARGKRQSAQSWEFIKTLNARTTELAPMYCLGKRIYLGRQKDLDVAVVEHNGKTYVSVANTMRKIIPQAVITLPKTITSTGQVLYENRTLSPSNDTIVDDFKPLEVHIYRFP